MATPYLPRRGVTVPGCPPTITLPLGDRREIEAVVETLIAALDALDGDPDLEPEVPEENGDDEPSLVALPTPELPHARRLRQAQAELEGRSRLRRAGLVPDTGDSYARDFELLTTVWSDGRL